MDSIGGAAGFMALATVGVYVAISSTSIHLQCAHFTNVIAKAHLYDIQGTEPVMHPPDFRHVRGNIIEIHGVSSPHIAWDHLHHTHHTNPTPETLNTPIERLQPLNFANQDLLSCGTGIDETQDPSAFFTPAAEKSY